MTFSVYLQELIGTAQLYDVLEEHVRVGLENMLRDFAEALAEGAIWNANYDEVDASWEARNAVLEIVQQAIRDTLEEWTKNT